DDCHTVAKREIETIAANVGQSTTNDGLMVLPLSEVSYGGEQYQPKDRRRLGDASVMEELKADLKKMECSSLSLSLVPALRRVKDIADSSSDRITVHLMTDFRRVDWTGDEAKEAGKLMAELGKHKNVKYVYLVDCAHPRREPGQGGVPVYHDNLAIVEVRPSTRVASVGSTVMCTVTVANFSPRDASVKVVPYNAEDGAKIKDKNYEPAMPLKVPAGKTAQATFSVIARKQLLKDEQKA